MNKFKKWLNDMAVAIKEKTGESKIKPITFPEKIRSIETGADVSGVTATAEDVLNGKKFVDARGNVIDGTMPNLGSKIIWWRNRPIRNPEAINQGGIAILEIEEGYHDGTSGIQLTFEYPKRYTPTKERKRFSSSYSTGMFLGDIDIDPIPDQYQDVTPVTATAEDVRAGKVFVDAEGNAVEGALSGTIADVSGVTATAANVLQGKTIVDADGNEVEGSIPVVETSEVELSVQTPSSLIPVGYYSQGVALSVAAKSAAVTPTKETQNLADSFYDRITVDPIPEEYQNVSGVTATAEDVVEGKVIVDAQGNEVVGTLVPGGGGGSLPAGVYLLDDRVNLPPPRVGNSTRPFFLMVLNGELYAMVNQTVTSAAKNICKFNNGAWETIGTGSASAIPRYSCTELNGKIYLNHYTEHRCFDGSTITKYTSTSTATGVYPVDDYAFFAEDGTMKFIAQKNAHAYVWDESTDTWAPEDYENEIGAVSYGWRMYTHDGKVYCQNGKQFYAYDHGKLTLLGSLSTSIPTQWAFHKNYFYYSYSSNGFGKFNLETKKDTFLGYLPGAFEYNNMYNYLVSIGDNLHHYAWFDGSSVGIGINIVYEVTE